MADLGAPEPAGLVPSLPSGTHVEVESGLDGTWQDGFVVEEITSDGYRLRREMDDVVLPEVPHDRVRRRRHRSTWWI